VGVDQEFFEASGLPYGLHAPSVRITPSNRQRWMGMGHVYTTLWFSTNYGFLKGTARLHKTKTLFYFKAVIMTVIMTMLSKIIIFCGKNDFVKRNWSSLHGCPHFDRVRWINAITTCPCDVTIRLCAENVLLVNCFDAFYTFNLIAFCEYVSE